MSKSIAMVALGLGVMLFAIMLAGCSEEPALSLDDYLAELDCESFQGGGEWETYGDMAADMSQVVGRMAALAPPSEIADWHRASLTTFEKTMDAIDEFPKGDAIDFGELVAIFESLEADEADQAEIVSRMPDDVRQRMIEAGCIDAGDEAVSDDSAEDDHANFGDLGATTIDVDATIEGVIDYDGDSDVFRFTPGKGQTFQVEVERATLPDMHVSWQRFPVGGGQVVGGDAGQVDSGTWKAAWKSEDDREFYYEIIVQAPGSEVGSYTLSLSQSVFDDHADSVDKATSITDGVAVEGELNYFGDADAFSFIAEEGEVYQLDVASDTLLDPDLVLLNTSGEAIHWTGGYENRLFWEAPESQDYYVVVTNRFVEVGTYTVTVSHIVDDHANESEGATAVKLGEAVTGDINHQDDADYFRFTAEQGRNYEIGITVDTLSVAYVGLFDSDGLSLDSTKFEGGTYYGPIQWQASRPGEYYVRVTTEWGNDGGSYTLTITVQ